MEERKKPTLDKEWRIGNIKAVMLRHSDRTDEDGNRLPDRLSSKVVKIFKNKNDEWDETPFMSGQEHLVAEKLRGSVYEYEQHVLERDRERENEHNRIQSERSRDWADEDRSPEQSRRDAHDDRLAEDRSRTRRRAKPRDRSAR